MGLSPQIITKTQNRYYTLLLTHMLACSLLMILSSAPIHASQNPKKKSDIPELRNMITNGSFALTPRLKENYIISDDINTEIKVINKPAGVSAGEHSLPLLSEELGIIEQFVTTNAFEDKTLLETLKSTKSFYNGLMSALHQYINILKSKKPSETTEKTAAKIASMKAGINDAIAYLDGQLVKLKNGPIEKLMSNALQKKQELSRKKFVGYFYSEKDENREKARKLLINYINALTNGVTTLREKVAKLKTQKPAVAPIAPVVEQKKPAVAPKAPEPSKQPEYRVYGKEEQLDFNIKKEFEKDVKSFVASIRQAYPSQKMIEMKGGKKAEEEKWKTKVKATYDSLQKRWQSIIENPSMQEAQTKGVRLVKDYYLNLVKQHIYDPVINDSKVPSEDMLRTVLAHIRQYYVREITPRDYQEQFKKDFTRFFATAAKTYPKESGDARQKWKETTEEEYSYLVNDWGGVRVGIVVHDHRDLSWIDKHLRSITSLYTNLKEGEFPTQDQIDEATK